MTIKLLSIVLIVCMATCVETIQGTVKKENRNALCRVTKDKSLVLYEPIDISTQGISAYLQDVYNQREYVDVLSNDFSHVIQFLRYGKKTQQSHAYIKSILKLFSNKLKASNYVNAYAFSDLLAQLPALLADHFATKRSASLDPFKEKLNTILYSTFLSKYDHFKQHPQDFFNDLSQEILDNLQNGFPSLDEDISKEELRQAIIRFLDIALSKLIWNAQEPEQIWDSFKAITKNLENLMEHHIINDLDDLDDLLWTLIHRFCYFLDIVRPELSTAFYEQIKDDLTNQQLALLTIEEQEPLIEPKNSYLLQAVLEGQARKQGAEKGLLLE